MLELFSYAFMQKALVGGILIAIMCALLGIFLVLNRLSMLGDGLSHAALAGIALGMVFNVYPIFFALIFTGIGSLGIQQLIEKTKVYGDAAIAILLSAGMSIAVVIIGIVNGFNKDLFSYLFGSILVLSGNDLILISVMCILVVGTIILLAKKLLLISFHTELAKTTGIRVSLIQNIFVVLTAIGVVLASRAVGVLLVSALLVIPAISAFQIAGSFKHALWLAVVISIVGVFLGIIFSYIFDLPTGGTIVLVLCIIFLGVLGVQKINKIKNKRVA